MNALLTIYLIGAGLMATATGLDIRNERVPRVRRALVPFAIGFVACWPFVAAALLLAGIYVFGRRIAVRARMPWAQR